MPSTLTSTANSTDNSTSLLTTQKTILKYIKPTKNDSQMFLIEELAEEHIGSLFIKHYKDRDWSFLLNRKIRPNMNVLKKNRFYELEIKERKWDGKIVRTFYLHITPETLSYDEDKKNKNKNKIKRTDTECLFSHEKGQ